MSEEIIKEAERICELYTDGFIGATSLYDSPTFHIRTNLQSAIIAFKESEARSETQGILELNPQEKIVEKALEVSRCYTICIGDGYFRETDKVMHYYEYFKREHKKKEQEIKDLEKAHEIAIKEMQKTIDDMYDQLGIMKGRYEECSKRIEQMIQRAGLKQ